MLQRTTATTTSSQPPKCKPGQPLVRVVPPSSRSATRRCTSAKRVFSQSCWASSTTAAPSSSGRCTLKKRSTHRAAGASRIAPASSRPLSSRTRTGSWASRCAMISPRTGRASRSCSALASSIYHSCCSEALMLPLYSLLIMLLKFVAVEFLFVPPKLITHWHCF